MQAMPVVVPVAAVAAILAAQQQLARSGLAAATLMPAMAPAMAAAQHGGAPQAAYPLVHPLAPGYMAAPRPPPPPPPCPPPPPPPPPHVPSDGSTGTKGAAVVNEVASSRRSLDRSAGREGRHPSSRNRRPSRSRSRSPGSRGRRGSSGGAPRRRSRSRSRSAERRRSGPRGEGVWRGPPPPELPRLVPTWLPPLLRAACKAAAYEGLPFHVGKLLPQMDELRGCAAAAASGAAAAATLRPCHAAELPALPPRRTARAGAHPPPAATAWRLRRRYDCLQGTGFDPPRLAYWLVVSGWADVTWERTGPHAVALHV